MKSPTSSDLLALESRTGARSMKGIPPEVLNALHLGKTSTKNLVEWLAVNRAELAGNCLMELGLSECLKPIQTELSVSPKRLSALQQSVLIGKVLAQCGVTPKSASWKHLTSHPSDIIREWACTTLGAMPKLTLKQRLKLITPLAADEHFGVRELAWLAIRPHFVDELDDAIAILTKWSLSPDPNIRRFASEATRPCGVWTMHLKVLKQSPELGLPILEPLKADASRYVQDSVGNWLNDASKTKPDWVLGLTQEWLAESDSPATIYIVKRARRSLGKA